METSPASQLPTFEVERFHIDEPEGSYDMYQVRCSRCGAVSWFTLLWALIQPVLGREDDPPAHPVGRPCPYCSKVSTIPEELRIIASPNNPRPRRIVRRRRSKK